MDTHYVGLTIACWALLILCVAHCSPMYPNINDSAYSKVESMCTDRPERFIESNGKQSSLILDFKSGQTNDGLCIRILSAPDSYGFIVRLIRPKLRKPFHNAHAGPLAELNITRACPLRIFSSLDPLIPSWEVDPCQLEDSSAGIEDPVKLFQGRLRIVWEDNGQTISSKLMVTVLGKGDACQEPNKHPCLKIGIEPLLCISKDLVCDGIRHCPNSNEYDSDEDYAMCWKSKNNDYGSQTDLFKDFDFEAFRNLFAFDALPPDADFNNTKQDKDIGYNNAKSNTNNTGGGIGFTRRNTTRLGLNSDLSKYGPWGYLMLGMLLCGGALLICGLWECCYRINKSDHTITASASQSAHNDSDASIQQANVTIEHHSTPPNYEELDPPPSYSVLFPNQKAGTTESSSLSSISTTTPTSTSSNPNPTSASTTVPNTSS